MGSFEIIEHTGDIGVLARGVTVAEVFGEAARGMFSFMVDLDSVVPREVRRVEAEGVDREGLLVAWLNELIFLFETEEMVFAEFQVQALSDSRMEAICHGEKLDTAKRHVRLTPKAATYHMVEVAPEVDGCGWWARVIIDI